MQTFPFVVSFEKFVINIILKTNIQCNKCDRKTSTNGSIVQRSDLIKSSSIKANASLSYLLGNKTHSAQNRLISCFQAHKPAGNNTAW